MCSAQICSGLILSIRGTSARDSRTCLHFEQNRLRNAENQAAKVSCELLPFASTNAFACHRSPFQVPTTDLFLYSLQETEPQFATITERRVCRGLLQGWCDQKSNIQISTRTPEQRQQRFQWARCQDPPNAQSAGKM